MSATTATGIRDAIRSAFRGKPVERVELFGSAARGDLTSYSDVDILVTPSPEASRHDLFIMAAEVEEALGRPVDFLIRSDVEAMKNVEAKDLILKSAVAVLSPDGLTQRRFKTRNLTQRRKGAKTDLNRS